LPIYFHSEDIDFKLERPLAVKRWIRTVIEQHGRKVGAINYVFCTDNYLLDINNQYLKHDYYTDIVTFDNSDKKGEVAGDLFISIDRVKDNASSLKIEVKEELKRVMIHGILHLLGYKDKTKAQEKEIRQKENESLTLYKA
jgi:rRNA maturation RNase YbeY